VHCAAALPHNYIALEYPVAKPDWWYDIIKGLPKPIVRNSMIDVAAFDRPGLGVSFDVDKTMPHLKEEDKDFFDD
jgi:L-alanine-DL-glutamate epimerase-like enolase superfamily enzyme